MCQAHAASCTHRCDSITRKRLSAHHGVCHGVFDIVEGFCCLHSDASSCLLSLHTPEPGHLGQNNAVHTTVGLQHDNSSSCCGAVHHELATCAQDVNVGRRHGTNLLCVCLLCVHRVRHCARTAVLAVQVTGRVGSAKEVRMMTGAGGTAKLVPSQVVAVRWEADKHFHRVLARKQTWPGQMLTWDNTASYFYHLQRRQSPTNQQMVATNPVHSMVPILTCSSKQSVCL